MIFYLYTVFLRGKKKEKQSRGGSGSLAHGNLHLVRGNPAHPAPLPLSPPSLSISDEWKSLPERRFALLRHRSNARDTAAVDPRNHGDHITSLEMGIRDVLLSELIDCVKQSEESFRQLLFFRLPKILRDFEKGKKVPANRMD
ncbi:hypothetical protein NPIL_96971 [Nephila pilipes]|uniref:Uncharacterized protein n=1 Tax=Nephila pilipes TaxID=299642 RepID=A0A8X6PVD2_NEPPI|nr:hypothetical protein NPIL_96971 [Nephila pilipes]